MCISCNKKRKSKSSPRNSVQYISVVSPSSPQLTSSSSSATSATTSSSLSSESSHSIKTIRMAPNETSSIVLTQPSAPSPGLVLFNSEEQSDIVFLVGTEPEPIWRFPAHSFIVANASPVFKAIVECGERTNEKQIHKRINYCKPEIFQIILRHIYTNEIQSEIKCVANALILFTAANQFLLDELCRHCLTFLYDECNEENVLEMLSHFSQFTYLRPSFLTPDINSSPMSPYIMRQSSLVHSNNCDNILNELITRCYYTLDREATKILSTEAFSSLDHDLIVKILSRDTLNITSESVVFECIKRWSCQQCKRQCRELTGDNKRTVLGKALYCPRYLTMTFDEFMRGPQPSDLFNEQEKCSLRARLAGDFQTPLPVHLTGRKLEVRRVFVEKPKVCIEELSTNASASNTTVTNGSTNAGIVAKKKSTSKKLLNGLGDLVICVIRLLD